MMNQKKKFLIISIVGLSIIISSISAIFLSNLHNNREDRIQIEFTPEEMKSYPNHTAWLLLDIRSKKIETISNISISIKTNNSIKLEYKIWNHLIEKVIEIFLYPNASHLDKSIQIEAIVSNNYFNKTQYAEVKIVNWTLEIPSIVETMRDVFVSYMSVYHPNFKINEEIVWEEFGSTPFILVVEHYLFKSEFWEMELARHVMIAPYDWVIIYLRPRFTIYPNWSGTIKSWSSGNYTIIENEPPNIIYR